MASSDMIDRLLHVAVRRAEAARQDAPEILAAAGRGETDYGRLGNYSFLQSALLFGYLYAFRHPQNPLQGQDWCLELATAYTDLLPGYQRAARAKGDRSPTAEWNPLGTVELLGLLDPEGLRRADWMEFVESYIEVARERPFGFTAPNHDAWRELFLYRAGQLLRRPALCDLALFFCRQELKYQTPEGFWEEGQHHGPSMSCNILMLEPLAWLYRLSGDEEIGSAARRLAGFMAGWCLPDGCTVGAFDGRQSTAFGFGVPVCPGLELVPEGRTLNARLLDLCSHGDWASSGGRGSAWYDHFALFFTATALRYHAEVVPEAERGRAADASAGLPVDAEGVRRNGTPTFDGLLAHRGKWCLALSGQNSDMPRQTQSVFRLERASRIEVWHADGRLVLGGGHNRRDWPVPYANAILDTGYAGETQFGLMEQDKIPERRGYYLPNWCRTGVRDGHPELVLSFAHGTVNFRLVCESDHALRIEAGWELRCVRRLCLQLPLVVWRDGVLEVDGRPPAGQSGAPQAAMRTVAALGGPFGVGVQLTLPQSAPTRVRFPLDPLRYYIEPAVPDGRRPLFSMALASSQWTEPPASGTASWRLEMVGTKGRGNRAQERLE